MENKDIKIYSPMQYKIISKELAPDRIIHKIIINEKNGRKGYIHNKISSTNDNYYSAYIVYKIGEKVGLDVPETEVVLLPHQKRDIPTYYDEYVEASIVYDKNLEEQDLGKEQEISHIDFDVIFAEYLQKNPQKAQIRKEKIKGNAKQYTIDDYMEAYIYYLTEHGKKARQDYTKNDIDEIKQELVDRALFSLKYGTRGRFNVTVITDKSTIAFKKIGATLEPYYISTHDTFLLNVQEEWIKELLKNKEEIIEEKIQYELIPQYGLMPNTEIPTSAEVIKDICLKYPEQAKKAYEKLSQFTEQDFENLLAECSRISELHKELALRVYKIKSQEFDQILKEQMQAIEK